MTPGEAEQAGEELRLAAQALRAARLLLESDAREDAASRLYYAVFHAARAALTIRGLHSRTHTGQVALFRDTFGEAPILGELLTIRGQADYATQRFRASHDALEELARQTGAFIDRCDGIVRDHLESGPDEPDPPPDL